MKPAAPSGLAVLLGTFVILALIALPALAYQYPLSDSDIRNAYLLGYAKDLNTTTFFAQYVCQFPTPESGPHVATITLKTPYAQVAELGQSAVNSDVQGAEEEFANKKFSLLVRVEVDLTATYPAPAVSNPVNSGSLVPDFQQDFKIQLIQDGKKIGAQSTRVYLLTSEGFSRAAQVSGAILELKYDPDNVKPDEGVTVKVHTPDDQRLKATFDLSQLR
ncbi:MAG: hypothetical protein WA192_00140 [Candidatus Acidiferrales bacterium]